jgi:hypothetical protein
MGSVNFTEYQDKRILIINIAHCELEEIVSIIKETKKIISKEKEGSVLALTNVIGVHPSIAITKVLKDFVTFNKPYVRASAVVGVSNLQKITLEIVAKFSNRNFALFNNIDEAKNWLVTQ